MPQLKKHKMLYIMSLLLLMLCAFPLAAAADGSDDQAYDKVLIDVIRQEIAAGPEVAITEDEIRILTSLDAGAEKSIRSLDGLEHAVYLEELFVPNNQIEDLTVLSELPALRTVAVYGNPLNMEAASILEQLESRGVVVVEAPTSQPPQPIQVLVDDKPIPFTIDPVLVNGTTMVQFRPLFEHFGLEIGWDGATQTVSGTKERLKLELSIGETMATVDGQSVTLPVAPMLTKGNTMVPLRFVGEATGRRVTWDGETQTVFIDTSAVSYNFEFLYSNDTVYEGELVNGKPEGTGKLLYKGEVFYEGEFKNGALEGNGKMYDMNNPASYYEGAFVNNRFHGEGKTVYDDGSYHVGAYKNGLRDGQGKSYQPDGALSYEGSYVNEAVHGEGTAYLGEFIYEGMFDTGAFEGQGKMYHGDELIYDGEWEAGYRSTGKTYVDGKPVYAGTYRDDKPHGYGAFYDEQGQPVYRGQVKNYAATGIGIIYYEDGNRYIGEAFDGMADGQGVLKDSEGNVLQEGQFVEDNIDDGSPTDPNDSESIKKLLTRSADHSIIDGMYENSMGFDSTQAAMFIELASEEHVELFNNLDTNAKIELIHEYVMSHWGDVLGVNECYSFIVLGDYAYAFTILGYDTSLEEAKVTFFPEGKSLYQE